VSIRKEGIFIEAESAGVHAAITDSTTSHSPPTNLPSRSAPHCSGIRCCGTTRARSPPSALSYPWALRSRARTYNSTPALQRGTRRSTCGPRLCSLWYTHTWKPLFRRDHGQESSADARWKDDCIERATNLSASLHHSLLQFLIACHAPSDTNCLFADTLAFKDVLHARYAERYPRSGEQRGVGCVGDGGAEQEWHGGELFDQGGTWL
jgi:hypothetical protein